MLTAVLWAKELRGLAMLLPLLLPPKLVTVLLLLLLLPLLFPAELAEFCDDVLLAGLTRSSIVIGHNE